MDNASIKRLIDDLNGERKALTFLRPLTDKVDWAIHIMSDPDNSQRLPESFRPKFYFIKNEDGKYVASVEDRGFNDLHWYVTPEHRKKGYIITSMVNVIFPHIRSSLYREKQRITIDRALGQEQFMASQKVAETLGFKKIDEKDNIEIYEIDLDAYANMDIGGVDIPLGIERKTAMYKSIGTMVFMLDNLADEIEMSEGWIPEVDEIKWAADRVQDVYQFLQPYCNNVNNNE